jgi:hypothetical protein
MCICLAAFLRLARESGGGNAIKLLLRLILGLSLGVAMLLAKIQPSTLVFLPETFTAKTAFSAMRSASEPVLRYVAGSTIKVEQLIGEEDKQVTSTNTQPDRPQRLETGGWCKLREYRTGKSRTRRLEIHIDVYAANQALKTRCPRMPQEV